MKIGENKIKIFILFIIFFAGCENSAHHRVEAESGGVDDQNISNDEDTDSIDVLDSHTVNDSDGQSGQDGPNDQDEIVPGQFDFTTLIAVERKVTGIEFPNNENRKIVQSARLNIENGEVERNFGYVDTSFTLHPDDLDALKKLAESVKSCSEGEAGEDDFLRLRDREGHECRIEDDDVRRYLDKYLLIPVHDVPWPFSPQNATFPVGHSSVSYQDYYGSGNGAGSYFHHGVDIVLEELQMLLNIQDGRIVKAGRYNGGQSELYYEVVVKTVNGLTIQYHHVDEETVPDEILDAVGTAEVFETGAEIGKIISWPVVEEYSKKNFHHVHLNIITEKGRYLNGLQLLREMNDSTPPQIEGVYILNSSKTSQIDPSDISEPFRVAVEAFDLVDDNLWMLPPRYSEVTIKNEGEKIVFEHGGYDFLATLSTSYEEMVCDYYLCGVAALLSKGDYGNRLFIVDVTAFDQKGAKGEPIEDLPAGNYLLEVKSCDEYGNCAVRKTDIYVSR